MSNSALVSLLAGRKWTAVAVFLTAGALIGFGVARSKWPSASATVILEIGRINSCLDRLNACEAFSLDR